MGKVSAAKAAGTEVVGREKKNLMIPSNGSLGPRALLRSLTVIGLRLFSPKPLFVLTQCGPAHDACFFQQSALNCFKGLLRDLLSWYERVNYSVLIGDRWKFWR